MPRPGPRPYECVRRAWHSDRHQPIRGSLIQKIFSIVNEVHSPATKKNKEWQEKLPIVVLKAEEIIYSKANSEAEYMDVSTLCDRNDAINTIIRRDESTETGELLQPCIEAALHLGCTSRRSSRSQRNITPRRYLNPEKSEVISVPLFNLDSKVKGLHCCRLIKWAAKVFFIALSILKIEGFCSIGFALINACSAYLKYSQIRVCKFLLKTGYCILHQLIKCRIDKIQGDV